MPVLKARHTADVLSAVEIISVEHLLYWVDSFGEEATLPIVLSLAALAKNANWRLAFVDYVSPLIALIANCPLRALLTDVSR